MIMQWTLIAYMQQQNKRPRFTIHTGRRMRNLQLVCHAFYSHVNDWEMLNTAVQQLTGQKYKRDTFDSLRTPQEEKNGTWHKIGEKWWTEVVYLMDREYVRGLRRCKQSLSRYTIFGTHTCYWDHRSSELYRQYNRDSYCACLPGFPISVIQLNINGCLLSHLPDTIGQCTRLQRLALRNLPLKTLPPTMSLLTNLCHLIVEHVSFKTLPDVLFQCVGLHRVTFQRMEFQHIPDSISQLTQLRSLTIEKCKLQTFPTISNLMSLSSVHIQKTDIEEVPHLPLNIVQLDLRDNKLTSLCDLSRYTKLDVLQLGGHALSNFPEEIVHLNLKTFFCGNLQSLPKTFTGKLCHISGGDMHFENDVYDIIVQKKTAVLNKFSPK